MIPVEIVNWVWLGVNGASLGALIYTKVMQNRVDEMQEQIFEKLEKRTAELESAGQSITVIMQTQFGPIPVLLDDECKDTYEKLTTALRTRLNQQMMITLDEVRTMNLSITLPTEPNK